MYEIFFTICLWYDLNDLVQSKELFVLFGTLALNMHSFYLLLISIIYILQAEPSVPYHSRGITALIRN